MTNIPNDPIMLMSFLNTKLRDFYSSLDALCDDLDLNKQEILDKLSKANLEYNQETNQIY